MSKPEHEPHLSDFISAHNQDSVFSEPAIAAQGPRTIDQDLNCTRCGYNLRGLSLGGPCPECGKPNRLPGGEARPHHSVYEEPNIFAEHRSTPQVFDRDWLCSKCGYNLNGLTVSSACPKCGHIELYAPSPTDKPGYARWVRGRRAATSPLKSWGVTALAVLLSGPWAILGALLSAMGGLAGIVLFGPATEEVMKVAFVAMIVEVRPYLFKSVRQIRIAAILGATVFAAIENVLYLNVYVAPATPMIAAWRWSVCVALHVGCTTLAIRGVTSMWQQTMQQWRPPHFGDAVPWIITAIVVHAVYNAAATFFAVSQFSF